MASALDLVNGLTDRLHHLSRWHERISERLERRKEDPRSGAYYVQQVVRELLDVSETHQERFEVACRTARASSKPDKDTYFDVRIARNRHFQKIESCLFTIDTQLQPLLLARTESDVRHEIALRKLLEELGLSQVEPICVHKFKLDGTLAVEPLPRPKELGIRRVNNRLDLFDRKLYAIFYSIPHVRSLTTLALHYHEIGHLVWWRVLTKSEQKKLVALMRSANLLLPASNFAVDRSLAGEIAADSFGGIVGGCAYCATLCAFLIGKPDRWKNPQENYPPPKVRGWLARRGARIAGVADQHFGDSIFDGWKYLAEQEKDYEVDQQEAERFLTELCEMLKTHGIRIATAPPDYSVLENGDPIISDDQPVHEVIAIAAKYRMDSRDKFDRYSTWEKSEMKLRGWWQELEDSATPVT